MRLVFIGTGSAFVSTHTNYNTNAILETENNKRLLIDCGSDARRALYDANLTHADIDAVYISHLHGDHCGGLEWFSFCTKFDPNCSKPSLYMHPSLKDPLSQMLTPAFQYSPYHQVDLPDFFNLHLIDNLSFTWENIPFTIFQTVHIRIFSGLMPCFGVFTELNGTKVLLTSDTQFTPEYLWPFYQKADVIFHDCETSEMRTGVHSHYLDLKTLPPEIKRKIWLVHYQTGQLPDATLDGFRGFVMRGQSFDF